MITNRLKPIDNVGSSGVISQPTTWQLICRYIAYLLHRPIVKQIKPSAPHLIFFLELFTTNAEITREHSASFRAESIIVSFVIFQDVELPLAVLTVLFFFFFCLFCRK